MAISINEAFENCLRKNIEEGLPIHECAASYPQYENELVEILELTTTLKNLDQLSPRPRFVENAQQRLVTKLPNRNVGYHEKLRPIKRKRQVSMRLNYGLIRVAVVFVILFSAITGGTAYAADYAEPGDYLYRLDLAIEQVQLKLATTPEDAARIRLDIAMERLEEAEHKFSEGDVNNGESALSAYEDQIAILTEMVNEESGIEQEILLTLVDSAMSKHQAVLTQLLGKVPEPAKKGIQRAIDASSKSKKESPPGPPEDLPKGPPEDKNTGPPEDKGKPEEKIKDKPDKVKPPSGKP